MGMTLASPIAIARGILQDRTEDYRYADADLLEYGNGALRSLATLKPNLLLTEGEVECVAGEALQTVSFDDAHSLVDVTRVQGGNAVLPTDKKTMDAFMPGWMGATAGAAVNWMPNLDDPVRFYIYPKAPVSQVIEVIYIRNPGPFDADDDTELPETLIDAVAEYIVGMAEMRDDEYVNANRAQLCLAQFAARLGVKPAQTEAKG